MGRGNICTHHECEGVFYLDNDHLQAYCKICDDSDGESVLTARQLDELGIKYDFDGSTADWMYDGYESCVLWDDMLSVVVLALEKQFGEFRQVDRWRNGIFHVVLESDLFEIAVGDNEWSAAWVLLERTDVDDVGPNRDEMRRVYRKYLEAIRKTLVEGWGEAYGYGGPWTTGEKFTHESLLVG